ncbi:MAG: argininosuccinate lyase [Rhodospirillaceae bacterium]|nr:argininosuccinate lyase [Rhodospirillaceae bacterium]|tara:strand:- start:252 stop:1442 length:1191 start_codon:yes stop_codon:yes gene_type:complete
MTRIWEKGLPLDERILKFTAGEDHQLDNRLLEYDILASIAHAKMLDKQGLLTTQDSTAICNGLENLGKQHAKGKWAINLEEEDVHGAIESRLIKLIGPIGGAVHLGRSRNDQVLVALRLYLKDAAHALQSGALAVADSLDTLAKEQGNILLPGYTHMQPAMPSSVALWANGFATEIRDDAQGLKTAEIRADLNPLGSAAGYGTPGIEIDRKLTTELLQFSDAQEPVTAVQLSRGKAEAGLVFEIALLLGDLGRLAADLLLFYTNEFAFVTLPDEMTTGSSIMPQKRNPDVLELVRSSQAVATAALTEILSITAKLNSGYQRDLQRIKAPLFRSIDLANDTVEIMAHTLKGITFEQENIKLPPEINAAESANRLALKEGIPFRDAYRKIANSTKDTD